MNKLQALQDGYSFLGAYSHNKNEMKERAKLERAKGNKAVVVNIPADKLSRGYRGTGYAVYFIESEANKAARERREKTEKIRRMSAELARAKTEVVVLQAAYDAELATVDWDWTKD